MDADLVNVLLCIHDKAENAEMALEDCLPEVQMVFNKRIRARLNTASEMITKIQYDVQAALGGADEFVRLSCNRNKPAPEADKEANERIAKIEKLVVALCDVVLRHEERFGAGLIHHMMTDEQKLLFKQGLSVEEVKE